MNKALREVHIFANAALGKGLSGSDRIFIEFAKILSKKNKVVVHVWKEGFEMCKREGLTGVEYVIINVDFWSRFGFLICYVARIIKSIQYALFIKFDKSEDIILYSASEFWMDSFGALILRVRYKKSKWIAAWFQTAPNPIFGFTHGGRENTYRLSAFYYWLMQLPIKPLIGKFADFVLVNNDLEKKQFKRLNNLNKAVVILGAVNIDEINKYKNNNNYNKKYDCVFQGRFHPQKGVVELIKIWSLVVSIKPNAKLIMIGDGPLMKSVKKKISELGLEKNVKLVGYLFDGDRKYKIFSQSKVVVHPAFYDSGGMASAEAMAFGLPCVGFDLESYESYYPKGMIKVQVGNLEKFSEAVIELIDNKAERERIGTDANKMISENWSWDKRVKLLLDFMQ